MEIPPAASASVAYKVEVAVTPDSESSTISASLANAGSTVSSFNDAQVEEDLEIRYPVANFAYKIEVATLDSATDPAPGTPAL